MERIKWLDPIRGMACLLVVITHIISLHPIYGMYVSGCGKIGVWMFFILSAFLLTCPYCNGKVFDRRELLRFYIKRFTRIIPCYVIVLCILLSVNYLQNNTAFFNHLFMLEGIGHLWTVPVEFKFYIIAPIFFLLIAKVRDFKIYTPIIIIIMIVMIFLFPYTTYIENSISLFWYLPVFMMGMLLAILYNKYKSKFKNAMIFDVSAIIIILLVVISMPGLRYILFGIQPDRYLQNKYLYFGIAWSLFIIAIANGRYLKNVFSRSKILSWFGEISFPLYLVHYIVLFYANQYILNFKMMALFVIISSIVLAAVCHYIIELPFVSFIRDLSKKSKKRNMRNISFVFIIFSLIIGGATYIGDKNESFNSWENRLYVPTMIEKIDNQYFIMDCWNHRVLYNDSLDENISNWKTMTDENYKGGHTIASDGELYILDNTDSNQILAYHKKDDRFELKNVIDGVETRPHTVLYDQTTKKFLVIGSTSGIIYILSNNGGQLVLEKQELLEDIKNSYVRSISIIDGYLYTASGPGKIIKYDLKGDVIRKVDSYDVPDELYGMNQVKKFQNYYYVTANTDINNDVSKSTIIRTNNLENLKSGEYEVLKSKIGFIGQPYFMTSFDGRVYITEISATKGNGIRSFILGENDEIEDIDASFYWEDVKQASEKRYNSKYIQNIDLFLFVGQSNMSGKGDASLAPTVPIGYEYRAISDTTQLFTIQEPFGLNENNVNGINDINRENGLLNKTGGLVASFANSYYKTTGIPIVGVSASQGNTRISEWQPGSKLYNDAVDRLEKAKLFLKNSNRFNIDNVYLVWCQGESDGDNAILSETYYDSLQNIVNAMKRNKNIDKAFIIRIGESGSSENKYNEVINAQTDLGLKDLNTILISTRFAEFKRTGKMSDIYHYNQEGYNLVGEEAGAYAGQFTLTNKKPIIYDYKTEVYIKP